ncbi:MAG: hypothetical protein WHU94_12630 [Thermogemmata sp.]|jgi:hypothetical protein|uniref:Uncharacterized protein n=1 Tax=Thermogemmata fonticola TaxID=2755323 RepID=A0A7V9ACV3_9BACT|nr:hypothetical protein [Thermogemmata fonticola]MBA2227363.1 hypothetical protein [Thermogemmata fonticola]MCX8140395.1 hypothetical protein [Gemmataceae bacterium]
MAKKSEKSAESGEKRSISQMQMVRLAMQAKGPDAKPGELQEYILNEFHHELPTNLISNYKSQIKRQSGGGRRQPQIEDLETVRNLIKRLGADQVKRLVDVLA